MSLLTATPLRSRLPALRDRLGPEERRRLGGMAAAVAGLHLVGFALLAAATSGHHHLTGRATLGLGTGMLAYTLGLRHAFDADHISAIDNTTRKLMAEGQRPLSVGFFFSLGHSSVVFGLSVLLGFGVRAVDGQVRNGDSSLHHYGGLIGTSVSGAFLYVIAILNVVVLVSIVRMFVRMRRGTYDPDELEGQLDSRGFLNRFFGGLARRIDTPWKMYPVGVLFGLGFDTASEVALLVLSGTAVASGLPFWAVLALPFLFAAGMSLLDTIDGSFMNFAYGWAFSNPVRKVYYNIVITSLSVAAALVIGTVELVQVLASQLGLTGGFWAWDEAFDINHAGFLIAGLFVLTWVVALAVWRVGRVEERWDAARLRADAGG